jgi:hypothetical protein
MKLTTNQKKLIRATLKGHWMYSSEEDEPFQSIDDKKVANAVINALENPAKRRPS